MAAIPMAQLAITEKLHPFDAQFPAVALRGIVITLVAGTAAMLADLLPDALSLPLLGLIAAASIWLALRFALPLADRMSLGKTGRRLRSEEHTSELQSLMRNSYAVFCLKKKT